MNDEIKLKILRARLADHIWNNKKFQDFYESLNLSERVNIIEKINNSNLLAGFNLSNLLLPDNHKVLIRIANNFVNEIIEIDEEM